MNFEELVSTIRKSAEDLETGNFDYLPMPNGLGAFSKDWFQGRLKGQVTCITGGTSSAKTSLCKYIIFETILWAIKNKKKYKCLYFALEESVEEFEFSLLSYLVYKKSKGEKRYNIEHFLGIGKSVSKSDMKELDDIKDLYLKFRSYITVEDHIYNTFGIWKAIRDYARKNGKFLDKTGKPLTQEQLESKVSWSSYIADDPFANVEVVVDHLSELQPQTDQKDIAEAMGACVRDLRTLVAKKLKYHCFAIQQQMLEMENLEHIKEAQVYASIQGLGDNKRLARAYHNMIAITNINRVGLKIANTTTGNYEVQKLGDFQRVIAVLKKRYGKLGKTCVYFDGCCGIFQEIPEPTSQEYKDMLIKIKKYA